MLRGINRLKKSGLRRKHEQNTTIELDEPVQKEEIGTCSHCQTATLSLEMSMGETLGQLLTNEVERERTSSSA